MLDVEVTPRAAMQIEAAAAWWLKYRAAAPDAIRADFQEASAGGVHFVAMDIELAGHGQMSPTGIGRVSAVERPAASLMA